MTKETTKEAKPTGHNLRRKIFAKAYQHLGTSKLTAHDVVDFIQDIPNLPIDYKYTLNDYTIEELELISNILDGQAQSTNNQRQLAFSLLHKILVEPKLSHDRVLAYIHSPRISGDIPKRTNLNYYSKSEMSQLLKRLQVIATKQEEINRNKMRIIK